MRIALSLIAIAFLSGCCSNLKNITEKPIYEVPQIGIEYPQSHLEVPIKISLDGIETLINDVTSEPISDSNDNIPFKLEGRLKTENPVYNPTKWIKTKNLLYEPNKWIKIGPLKTKNPAYNPNRWIKTKNPAYSPNKWIYADIITVEGQYRYQYNISRVKPIEVSRLNDTTLAMEVSYRLDGEVGVLGKIAAFLSLNKKRVRGEIDLTITIVSRLEDKCLTPSVAIDYKWTYPPSVQFIGKDFDPTNEFWVNLEREANKELDKLISTIKKDISTELNCDSIGDHLDSALKPSYFSLNEELHFAIQPQKLYPTGVYVGDSYIEARFGLDAVVKASTSPFAYEEILNLQTAQRRKARGGYIDLNVPILFSYSFLREQIEDSLRNGGKLYSGVNVHGLDVYPSNDLLVFAFEVSVEPGLFSFCPDGVIYITGRPRVDENQIIKFEEITFTPVLDNDLYQAIGLVFRNFIEEEITSNSTYDFGQESSRLVDSLPTRIENQITVVNQLDTVVTNPIVSLDRIYLSEKGIVTDLDFKAGIGINVGNAAEDPEEVLSASLPKFD